jgi:hypothetical protein
VAIKIGRKWLLSVFAVPVAFAGVAIADPWLEKSPTAGRGWDDMPFLGPPQRQTQTKQRQPRGPEATRALEAKREMQRELHRMPATNRAADSNASANVFPPPRVPQQVKTAEPASETPAITTPVEVRNAKPSDLPHKPSHTAAARTRDGEQELQRQLDRTLPPVAVPPVPEQLACAERLAKIARYSPLPSRTGPGTCGATDLVRLDSILMADRSLVALNPAPQIRCSMAEQVAEWVREDVGPAAATALGSPLMSINDYDAYDCRPRNNVKGAKLSEHGKGNALDVGSFRLRNGGVFTLADQLVAKQFRDKVRLAACGRFMTVLGPGSDPYHGDHVHIDMAERSHNTKICQWNVRETVIAAQSEPEPSQRPAASAPPAAAAPVVPPKVEAKIESKIEAKPEPKNEPQAPAVAAAPKVEPVVTAEPPMPRPKPPAVAEAPVKPAVEAPKPQLKEQVKDEQPKDELSRDQARKEQPKDKRPSKSDVAAATPKEPEARQERKDEASPSQVAEAQQPSIESPPLPRRKPEALQRLAEIQQQPETPNRSGRETRGERPRHYDSRHRFERDVRRFMRNFF